MRQTSPRLLSFPIPSSHMVRDDGLRAATPYLFPILLSQPRVSYRPGKPRGARSRKRERCSLMSMPHLRGGAFNVRGSLFPFPHARMYVKKRAGRNTGRQSKTFGKSKGSRPAVRNVTKAEAASWLRWLGKRFFFLLDALQVRQCVCPLRCDAAWGVGFLQARGRLSRQRQLSSLCLYVLVHGQLYTDTE